MVKKCHKCEIDLVVHGVHQGIPFAKASVGLGRYAIYCSACYDAMTVNLDTKVQRTGEEVL